MTRRDLLAGGVAAGLGLAGLSGADGGASEERELLVPRPLRPGDRVAVVTPASVGRDEQENERFLARLRGLGWEPVLAPHFGAQHGYLAGTDAQRTEGVNWAFGREDCAAVMPVRGGYGSTRILGDLDFGALRRFPKVLLGFSDITALLVGAYQEAGVVTYHGNAVLATERPFAHEWMRRAVVEGAGGLGVLGWPETEDQDFQPRTVRAGVAEGRLVGGNLSLLAAMCGTRWQMRGAGHVVFLEDVNEAPYRLDRMLTQMISAGCFAGVVGVLVGQFTNCDSEDPDSAWKVVDVVEDRLGGLGVPVLAGAPVGHVGLRWTLPVGARCRMDAGAGVVEALAG